MGHSESEGVQKRGRGADSAQGYFAAAVLKSPWPINRLFEFPPQRACHVSIREGLFLLPVRLLAAGGSHTSHLAARYSLVPGRLSSMCVCVCACVHANAHARLFVLSGLQYSDYFRAGNYSGDVARARDRLLSCCLCLLTDFLHYPLIGLRWLVVSVFASLMYGIMSSSNTLEIVADILLIFSQSFGRKMICSPRLMCLC